MARLSYCNQCSAGYADSVYRFYSRRSSCQFELQVRRLLAVTVGGNFFLSLLFIYTECTLVYEQNKARPRQKPLDNNHQRLGH